MNNLPLSIISNIFNPVGPSAPGGLEVFNYYLTKKLEEKNNIDLKLLAAGDSEPIKSLNPIVQKSLAFSKSREYLEKNWNYRVMTVEEFGIYAKLIQDESNRSEKRLLHFSAVNFLPVYLAIKQDLPILFTIHMPITNYHYQVLTQLLNKEELNRVNFIGISKNQIKDFPYAKRVVYNGISTDEFKFSKEGNENYISIGRVIKEKGWVDAITASKKSGAVLHIAGAPKDADEKRYFEKELQPKFSRQIKYKGYVSAEKRSQFYKAKALIFTPKINEAFGLTMIESMACGTPVIAYDRGAVREVIEDGKTGFIVKADNINGLARAMVKMSQMSQDKYLLMRERCRENVIKNFSLDAMVDNYMKIYMEIYQNYLRSHK